MEDRKYRPVADTERTDPPPHPGNEVARVDREPAEFQPGAHAAGDPRQPSGAERARQALDQAKADARRRGAATRRDSNQRSPEAAQPGRSARGPGGADPLPLSSVVDELLAERGWDHRVAVATVFARWPEIVGSELAAHTRPESCTDEELVVVADSAAWATQVRLLSGDLQRRVREELGDSAAPERVRVQGPGAGTSKNRFRSSPGPR